MKISSGSWPVMLTPFNSQLQIDWSAYAVLIDFYLQNHSTGLFTACWSSEVTLLHNDEKVKLAAEAVRHAQGVPIAAGAIAEGTLEQQAELIRRVADTGAQAVVISASQIAPSSCDDSAWRLHIEKLMRLTDHIPMGIYECPSPYHRILSPETIQWLMQSGRFIFHKDTSCDTIAIKHKLDAVRDSPLQFFNAHTPTLIMSLRHGGAGYCGVGANFFPELFALLCRNHADDRSKAERLLRFINSAQPMIDYSYPVSAKYYLARRGVPIKTYCRITDAVLTQGQMQRLEDMIPRAEKAYNEFTNDVTPHPRRRDVVDLTPVISVASLTRQDTPPAR